MLRVQSLTVQLQPEIVVPTAVAPQRDPQENRFQQSLPARRLQVVTDEEGNLAPVSDL